MKVYEVEKWVPCSFAEGAIHFQVKEVSLIQEFKKYGVKRTIRLIRDGAISFSKLRAAVVMEIAYLEEARLQRYRELEGLEYILKWQREFPIYNNIKTKSKEE